jgi:ketosteroid isomerase-like protein
MSRLTAAAFAAVVLGAAISLRRHRAGPTRALERYYEAWSKGDTGAVRDLLADDYRGHVHALAGTEERGTEQLLAAVASHSDAFERTVYTVEEAFADHDRVAGRVSMKARHRETGREAEINGLVILKLDGERIAEEWSSWDYLGLAEQLGITG